VHGHGAPDKNIENNPMQSRNGVAGMNDLPPKTFDTSGKSPAGTESRLPPPFRIRTESAANGCLDLAAQQPDVA
jgi:hypothetical protein